MEGVLKHGIVQEMPSGKSTSRLCVPGLIADGYPNQDKHRSLLYTGNMTFTNQAPIELNRH